MMGVEPVLETDGERRLQVVVWGSGDVGSAVAVELFRHGQDVVLLEDTWPTVIRRGMAFADAVFDGSAELEGVTARRVTDQPTLAALLAARAAIPLVVSSLPELLAWEPWDVLVDARMRKRARPEPLRGLVPLTIGLGPNFVAGQTVDIAIETAWGDDLGRVITEGATQPLRGEPRAIAGHARDRYLYAPAAGAFHALAGIGDRVRAGDLVARLGDQALRAPLAGTVRGITRDGVAVAAGTKVFEIDPRLEGAVVTGVGERPARIAAGVAQAVDAWRLALASP